MATLKLYKPIPRDGAPHALASKPISGFHASAIRVLELDRDHAVGAGANVLAIIWRHHTTIAAIDRAERHLHALMADYPDGVGLLQLAEPTATPPSGVTRAALAAMLKSGSPGIKSSSLVYAGTGFHMAAARAFVTGLRMLTSFSFPHEIFATVDQAADWHARLLPRAHVRYTAKQDIVALADRLTRELDESP